MPERWLPIGRPPASPEVQRERLIDEFQRSVKVERKDRSRTVNVSFTATRPRLAAEVLNTLTDLYLVARMEDRLDNAKRSSAWLTDQIQKPRDQAQQSGAGCRKLPRLAQSVRDIEGNPDYGSP